MVEPKADNTAIEMTVSVDGDNCVEPESDNMAREMMVDDVNCVETVETLPDKSRSLRHSSVQKRLETEKARSQPRVRDKISKKYRLSKYRRKTENAKERERMKKFNEAFTTLRKILPNSKLSDENIQCEKDTKVCRTWTFHVNFGGTFSLK